MEGRTIKGNNNNHHRGNNHNRVEMNYRIRDPQVRVIDENGEQLGVMTAQEANRLADSKSLDLVKINPQVTPPICKIMDYGKFKFDASKREKEQKRNSKNSELREMVLSMNIDKHDLETKARKVVEFLSGGDKVKVSLKMRGREQAHAKLGVEKLEQFFALCESVGAIDQTPKTEGRNIVTFLVPIKKVATAKPPKGDADKKTEKPKSESKESTKPKPEAASTDAKPKVTTKKASSVPSKDAQK